MTVIRGDEVIDRQINEVTVVIETSEIDLEEFKEMTNSSFPNSGVLKILVDRPPRSEELKVRGKTDGHWGLQFKEWMEFEELFELLEESGQEKLILGFL